MEHDLKCWPEYFCAVLDGSKPFEVRRADRPYRVGDVLRLREWRPQDETYTGRECKVDVLSVYRAVMGVYNAYCVMGIRLWGSVDDQVDRLRKGLRHAETVMMCVEPRNHKKEYLTALDLIRDVLDGGSVEMIKRSPDSATGK